MKHFVYVLWSDKLNKRYIGMTDNIDRRVSQHNSGGNQSTKNGRPWIIIFTESFEAKTEAASREKYLKLGIGREWLDKNYPHFSRRRRA
ncbi:GIY-YIG nuclease family protein [bacterium]|nr:GIY-YIG nuclease family protein [bacterium]